MSEVSKEPIKTFYRESAICPHSRLEAAAERLRSWPGWSLMFLHQGFSAEITTDPLEVSRLPGSYLLVATISPHPLAGGKGSYHPRMFTDVLAWAIAGDPEEKPPHMASYPAANQTIPGREL